MSIYINVYDHVLYEDTYLLLVHKPCTLMVEPDRNGYPNLLHQVRKYLKDCQGSNSEVYAQHIHRLDRPVSGIVLFAKDKSVLKNLSEQFAERKVKKYYQALTAARPFDDTGTLVHWHRKEKKKAAIVDPHSEFAEQVVLDYKVEEYGDDRFLWHIALHTGKFHQIRAQLAEVGCPILGDSTYGSTQSYAPNAIALHAQRLVFSHPITGKELSLEVSAPWF